jgi:hypothetical protein
MPGEWYIEPNFLEPMPEYQPFPGTLPGDAHPACNTHGRF